MDGALLGSSGVRSSAGAWVRVCGIAREPVSVAAVVARCSAWDDLGEIKPEFAAGGRALETEESVAGPGEKWEETMGSVG